MAMGVGWCRWIDRQKDGYLFFPCCFLTYILHCDKHWHTLIVSTTGKGATELEKTILSCTLKLHYQFIEKQLYGHTHAYIMRNIVYNIYIYISINQHIYTYRKIYTKGKEIDHVDDIMCTCGTTQAVLPHDKGKGLKTKCTSD